MPEGVYIVADFGKTLSKLTLWTADGVCLDRMTRANQVVRNASYRMLDVDGITAWLLSSLAKFADHPVKAIIPVSHGAAVAGIKGERRAFDPIDYEQDIPPQTLQAYRALRSDFSETGSPPLPQGLNFGSQIHWLEALHPAVLDGVTLLPYAQYWAWVLSGVAVSEVTSLGCHSDLWSPANSDYSGLAKERGWAEEFAPLAKASDAIGTLKPEIAAATGLPQSVKIYAGLHDSNAALIAARGFEEISGNEATVLSTGTWFIAMRPLPKGGTIPDLPEGRDCLVNVDAYGAAVPSARFMGGREIETLIEIDTRQVDIKPDQPALLAAVGDVIANGTFLLPSFAPGFGPYPDGEGRWINRPEDWYQRRAAACLYAALVTDTLLTLIGTQERVLIEGRFAEAQVFVRALASLRPDLDIYVANEHNDVSFGALRLIDPGLRPDAKLTRVRTLDNDMIGYALRWQELVR